MCIRDRYRNDFSPLVATILRVNNLMRGCVITAEERQELLLMLYKGSGHEKVNRTIRSIQEKYLKECPYGYAIGLANTDNSDYIPLRSNFPKPLEAASELDKELKLVYCSLNNSDINECTLCKRSRNPIIRLNCGDSFHKNCVSLHVLENKDARCPICYALILKEELENVNPRAQVHKGLGCCKCGQKAFNTEPKCFNCYHEFCLMCLHCFLWTGCLTET
eukprot:TRINITY_DN6027_c0_g2_i7.p1 TRINITY_DN6027_c0_g2~~TRINITY_DN6027_c0_g2_i7.p1  ORF type:complete len:220 (+),score=33.12 TRINITY_DN6027_c0_g2_i7:73-732(+)